MITAIISAFLFVMVSFVLRFTVFKRQAISKPKASWLSFLFAIIATTLCTLLSGGQQQSTLITGFATILICYNVLSYQKTNL